MDKNFLDNHPALQVIRETVEEKEDEENEEVQVGRKIGHLKYKNFQSFKIYDEIF